MGLVAALAGAGILAGAYFDLASKASPAPMSYADRMGTVFTALPKDLSALPQVREIPIPYFDHSDAIWGSSGRDNSGHLWFGVAAEGRGRSAHLLEFDPQSGKLTDRGDVVNELKHAGLYRPGEGQLKIHTKIVQAEDGYLYFGSFDEEGETNDKTSKWGGHLWRYRPGASHWEHLFATPQSIIALAGNGPWIYALGYWDHVLFQYNVRTGSWRHVTVGSVPGHVSRNIVADINGHVYVPRVRARDAAEAAHSGQPLSAELVEFDTDLKEVASTPLEHHADRAGPGSHGLIGFAYLADNSIAVTTFVGYLYRIVPSQKGPAKIDPVGWIDPDGSSYAASVFPIDGRRFLAAVTSRKGKIEWVIYDLMARTSLTQPLSLPGKNQLIYGTSTRDDEGRFYLVGRQEAGPGANKPIALQLRFPN
jgi:hypothetical protein